MFAAPPVLKTEVFARVPDELRAHRDPRHQSGVPRDCFIEGPSFDREGNLYITNIPYGQVFKISPAGEFTLVATYDGEPNGLKIHRDGRIFLADHKQGLMLLDPNSGKVETYSRPPASRAVQGPQRPDLRSRTAISISPTRARPGCTTRPGGSTGCTPNGRLDLLLDNVPSPNGLVLTPDEDILYLAVTRGNAVWRVPLHPDGSVGRVGIFIQMSGGTGPDGMAMDSEGNLAVCHVGMGSVWLFSKFGRPLYELPSCTGHATTNAAYGGPDGKTLYITESETGTVLKAQMEVPGLTLFSHK